MACLARFPEGATVDEVSAFFDHANTREHYRRQLRKLVAVGVVVKVVTTQRRAFAGDYARGPVRRVRFRLADPARADSQAQVSQGGGRE